MTGNVPQQRILRIIVALAGHEFDGVRPRDLVNALGISPASVTRDMSVLREEGFVEQLPGIEERWRLGPKMIQIAQEYLRGVAAQERKFSEILARYGRAI